MSFADSLRQRRSQRLETCKHFNGVQHDACRAGVAYESFPKTGPLPCLPSERPCVAECAKREFPTLADVEAREVKIQKSIDNTLIAIVAIVDKIGPFVKRETGGQAGSIPCPVCHAGELHYSRSGYNGHLHGACTTANCVRWMQ